MSLPLKPPPTPGALTKALNGKEWRERPGIFWAIVSADATNYYAVLRYVSKRLLKGRGWTFPSKWTWAGIWKESTFFPRIALMITAAVGMYVFIVWQEGGYPFKLAADAVTKCLPGILPGHSHCVITLHTENLPHKSTEATSFIESPLGITIVQAPFFEEVLYRGALSKTLISLWPSRKDPSDYAEWRSELKAIPFALIGAWLALAAARGAKPDEVVHAWPSLANGVHPLPIAAAVLTCGMLFVCALYSRSGTIVPRTEAPTGSAPDNAAPDATTPRTLFLCRTLVLSTLIQCLLFAYVHIGNHPGQHEGPLSLSVVWAELIGAVVLSIIAWKFGLRASMLTHALYNLLRILSLG